MKEAQKDKDIKDESLREQLRALPGTIWILVGGLFVHRFGSFVVPFLTLYLKDQKGYGGSSIGLVFFFLGLGAIGAAGLGGWLTDRVGRKNTMTISLVGCAIAMMMLWISNNLVAYCFFAFLTNFFHGMYQPAANSLVTDLVSADRRVTAFAVVRWATKVGFGLGLAAGGYFAHRGQYGVLFIGDALTAIIFAMVTFFALPHGIRSGKKEESSWGFAIRDILGNRRFVIFFVANFIAVLSLFHWGSSLAIFISGKHSAQVYGNVMMLNTILIVLFEIPVSQITRRFSPTKVIALGFLLLGMGIWINAFVTTGLVIILLAMTVFAIGEMISMPVSFAYVAELSPEKMRGRYAAVNGLSWSLGQAVAPWIGLWLFEKNPAYLWWGCLALAVVSACLMLISNLPDLTKNRINSDVKV